MQIRFVERPVGHSWRLGVFCVCAEIGSGAVLGRETDIGNLCGRCFNAIGKSFFY